MKWILLFSMNENEKSFAAAFLNRSNFAFKKCSFRYLWRIQSTTFSSFYELSASIMILNTNKNCFIFLTSQLVLGRFTTGKFRQLFWILILLDGFTELPNRKCVVKNFKNSKKNFLKRCKKYEKKKTMKNIWKIYELFMP